MVTFGGTHVVGDRGAASWHAPDAALAAPRLDPHLPVQVIERQGNWARVRCENGWETWTDARALQPIEYAPPVRLPAEGSPSAPVPSPVFDRPRPDRSTSDLVRFLAGTGAVLAVVSTLLPWFRVAGFKVDAWDLYAWPLVTNESSVDGPKVALVVCLGLLALLAVVVDVPASALVALGALVSATALLTIYRWVDSGAVRPRLGSGPIVAILAGGIIAGAGIVLSTSKTATRTT